jgi:hypothetical protein
MNERASAGNERTEDLRCASCGEKFRCGAKTAECWCFAVEISRETLADLQKRFRHCLCPQCLNKSSALLLQKQE